MASLASLSLVTITSHHIRHHSTNTVIFHRSSVVARLVPAPVQRRLKFSRHGTSVTVNDLFGDMPVRVKSRALALQKPAELEREWDHLRHLLVALMLANDKLKRLVVEDAGRNRKLTVRSRESFLTSSPNQVPELDIQRINSVLAQANLADLQNSDYWNAVSAGIPNISIRAAISLVPSPTKTAQFISFGTEPLFPPNNTNWLYSEINRLFALSDFGTIGAMPARHARGHASQREGNSTLRSPTKTINRWPMFYIRINADVPPRFYDGYEFLPESDKSVQHVMDILSAMVYEFLKQHNLRPRGAKRQRNLSQLPEDPNVEARNAGKSKCAARLERQDAPVLSTEEAFDGRLQLPSFQKAETRESEIGTWPRAKGVSGTSTTAKGSRPGPDSTGGKDLFRRPPESDSDNWAHKCSLVQNIPAADLPEGLAQRQTESDSPGQDGMIPWVDPNTGRTYLVNARTGETMSPSVQALAHNRTRSTWSVQPRPQLRRRPATAIPSGARNIWIENLLKKWDNPAFRRSQRPITSADVRASHEHRCGKLDVCDGSGETRGLEMTGFAKFSGKLKREHLELAEVIAQVDRKFIFVRMKAISARTGDRNSDTILALIDQHAADERCRVEQLFQDLFAPSDSLDLVNIKSLSDPIVFEVPSTEVPLFRRYLEFFTSWGVHYRIDHKPGCRGLGRVNALPALIAERCRSEPNLAIELIRAEIWRREEGGGPSISRRIRDSDFTMNLDQPDSESSWVDRLSGCPEGIVDLLNSRACRSAIMFNDVLTVDECQNLISRLARCVFPFQCAHGRPSMVPILDLQSAGVLDSRESSTRHGAPLDFVTGFRSWQGTLAGSSSLHHR